MFLGLDGFQWVWVGGDGFWWVMMVNLSGDRKGGGSDWGGHNLFISLTESLHDLFIIIIFLL